MEASFCSYCIRRLHKRIVSNAVKSYRYDTFRYKSTSPRSHMSAWMIHQYGRNNELSLSHTAKVPTIHSPDEMLIEVHGASVNPIDVKMREGYGQVMLNILRKRFGNMKSGAEFPLILGRDFSGVVVETGKKVKKYKPGDEVWGAVAGHRQGTHAQLVVASENEVSNKPKTIDHIAAASIPYVATTTWSAMCSVGELTETNTAGKRVLVLAGSGGLGSFAVQLMHAWGAEVTSTCSTDAVEMVRGLGAHNVIDYTMQNVEQELRKLDRFDFILDTIGGDTPQYSLGLLKEWRNAKYVSIVHPFLKNTDQYGAIGGSVMSAAYVMSNVAKGFLGGRSYRFGIFMPNGRALNKVAQMVDNSEIQPIVEKTFSFEEAPNAFDKVAAGHARGKTVIEVKN